VALPIRMFPQTASLHMKLMLLLAWPLTYVPAFLKLPKINDVTTDVAAPPRFVTLAKLRTGEANPAAYPGARFANARNLTATH